MCLSFVPPCITTCIANEDKRDDKRRSSLLFLHTFPTQHAYLSAVTEVNACYEQQAEVKWLDVSIDLHRSNPMRQLPTGWMLSMLKRARDGQPHISACSDPS